MKIRNLFIFTAAILVIIYVLNPKKSLINYSNQTQSNTVVQPTSDFLTQKLSSKFKKIQIKDIIVISDADKDQVDKWTADFRVFEKYFYTKFNNWKRPPKPFTLILFADRMEFASIKFCESDYGCYFNDDHTIVTHINSGVGTLAHELVHGFMNYSNISFPNWLNEGLPMYFEKFYGYQDNENLNLAIGFHNPWRLVEWAENINQDTTIKQIINNQSTKNESRVLVIFLDQNGWFIPYIKNLPQKNEYSELLEIMDMNSHTAEQLWHAYQTTLYSKVNSKTEISLTLPLSILLPDKKSWDTWTSTLPASTRKVIINRLY